MGVDLRLLPVDGDCVTWGCSHTMLNLDRDYELWDAIKAAKPFALETYRLSAVGATVPDGSRKGATCYGRVTETPYGERITYLDSPALIAAFRSVADLSAKNRAALAWLEAYTAERPCKVALYWH